ncbi:hypothetical protein [Paenibacillus wynnii]|uniref:hypothetical protein n=1 Tax=Paenibacillus wynnii TaxID=268407 RepID=UPI00278D0627|nr:hypothetical protein [Paenibacillus wynnii]MDQ0192416.1 hypothetical protein [Paenibacillus wynnii]
MNFEQLLATYLGRTVEVFLEDEFFTGQLIFVGNGFFTLSETQGYYAPVELNILNTQAIYVRVLM